MSKILFDIFGQEMNRRDTCGIKNKKQNTNERKLNMSS